MDWGRGVPRPPPRKRPKRIGIGLKCMFIAQFYKTSLLKKIRPITLIVWALGWVEKMPKKRLQKCKRKIGFSFKQISKCNTCIFIHFSRAFQKYNFYICSFSHKKVMGYFRFFYTVWNFYCPVPYPSIKKMFLQKLL